LDLDIAILKLIVARPTDADIVSAPAVDVVVSGAANEAIVSLAPVNVVRGGASQNKVVALGSVERTGTERNHGRTET
jgi:hypothetical protein